MMPSPRDATSAAQVIFEPRTLIAEVAAAFSARAGAKGVEILPLVYGNVPPWLSGDASKLRQVLNCLVHNAVRFTESGQIVISATRESFHREAVTLRFAVADTGSGITAQTQANLFHSFSAPNGRGASNLTMTRQAVERLGGGIGVESAPGRGSTFWFSGQFTDCTPAQYATLQSQEIGVRPLRVLVAEDEPVNQRVTLHHLSHLGITADLAEDGEAALALWEQNPYDVVLMDCYMPRMDGFAAATEMRRRERGLRQTVIIALTTDPRRDKCQAFGMDEYLQKPVRRHALAARLRHWSEDRRLKVPTVLKPQPNATFQPLSDEEINSQLIGVFLEDAPNRLARMFQSLEKADYLALEREAHTLKSSSALIGADQLSALCAILEELTEHELPSHAVEADSALRDIQAEFLRVQPSLEVWAPLPVPRAA